MRKQKRHYQYVIVGAGTTTYAAIEAIRAVDVDADILIISEQSKLPRLDLDSREEDNLMECDSLADSYNEWRRHVNSRLESEPDAYSTSPLTLLLGKSKFHIDVEDKSITMKDGTKVTYDRCLLASAGAPREFYVLDSSKISYSLRDRINTMTTLQDFVELDNVLASDIDRIAVVGGGFLGTEVACSLAKTGASRGIQVSHVFVESTALQRHLPPYLSQFVTRKLGDLGIDVQSSRLVTGLEKTITDEKNDNDNQSSSDTITVSMMGWEEEALLCDYVVLASTHIKPKTDMVNHLSGIEVDTNNGGIVVNAAMEAIGGLYVAGNLASYYDSTLGRRRVDRYEHAINSGLVAGHNMASSRLGSAQKMYKHSPSFRSRIPGIGVDCRAIGEIDSSLRTVGVWIANRDELSKEVVERTPDSDFKRGIVYYLRNNTVVGVLMWNAGDQMKRAREVLQQKLTVNEPATDLQDAILLGPTDWIDTILSGF
jgi:programmed cell death 8 (apoptosis-inducing factor)